MFVSFRATIPVGVTVSGAGGTITGDGREYNFSYDLSGPATGIPVATASIAPVNTPPSITTNPIVSVPENQTHVIDVNASDPEGDTENGGGLVYSKTGGADQAAFTLNTATGILTFVTAPDFEAPGDADGDNVYNVQVTVTDSGGLTDVQTIAVTVTDVDDVAPTATLSTSATAPVGGAFTVDIAFSEPVTGLALSEITVGNGTASNLQGAGQAYTVDVTPSGSGAVTVDIAADVAVDGAGNGNEAAPQFSITADLTGPTVTLSSAVRGIWTFASEDRAGTNPAGLSRTVEAALDGVRASIEAGADLSGGQGFALSLSVSYDGIGDADYEALGLRIGVRKAW